MDTAKRSLKRLDRQISRDIVDDMDSRITLSHDPRVYGKALTGSLKGRWRFRVRDFRIVCAIRDDQLIVLVLDVGHLENVYD